jgi:UPF0755 protein
VSDEASPDLKRRRRGRRARAKARALEPSSEKRKKPKGKPLRPLVWLAGAAVVFAGFATALGVWARGRGPGSGRPVVFEVGAGASKVEVANGLAAAGLVKSPRWFAAYALLVRPTIDFAPGPHYLSDELSARELVERLGRLPSRATARVTIPEGFNFREIAGRLDERQICPFEAFGRAAFDPALLRELSIPGPSAEGYLFPATYDLHVDSDPRAVVKELVAESRKRLLRLPRLSPSSNELTASASTKF